MNDEKNAIAVWKLRALVSQKCSFIYLNRLSTPSINVSALHINFWLLSLCCSYKCSFMDDLKKKLMQSTWIICLEISISFQALWVDVRASSTHEMDCSRRFRKFKIFDTIIFFYLCKFGKINIYAAHTWNHTTLFDVRLFINDSDISYNLHLSLVCEKVKSRIIMCAHAKKWCAKWFMHKYKQKQI